MKKPIIGIVGRAETTNEEDKTICVYEKSRRAIFKCGGIPIGILPPQNLIYANTFPRDCIPLTAEEQEDLKNSILLCDGIFMQGGNARYSYDRWICAYAMEHDIPILGVCMGMQILGEYDNRNSATAIPMTEKNTTEMNHRQKEADYVHAVHVEKDSLLYEIVGVEELKVNSLHSFHIPYVSTCKVSAISEDGLIEGIEDPTKTFALGVQWHPEGMVFYDTYASKIMESFIKASLEYHLKNSALDK